MKSNRRNFIRGFGAGAAALAVLPMDVSTLVAGKRSSHRNSDSMGKAPLVVIAKGDKLVAFKGLEEFVIRDPELIERLYGRFEEFKGEFDYDIA